MHQVQKVTLEDEFKVVEKMKGKKDKQLDMTSMKRGVKIITVSSPSSVNTEQFNTIRTNIQFSNADKEVKSLMVTSAMASEGKSTVTTNLAVTFARQGKKVVLLDADFRRPTINATFDLHGKQGVTNFLTEHTINIGDILYASSVKNLYVIPSGPIPPNPSELIGSNRMKKLISSLSEQADIVIYDAPPVLSVTDAQILSVRVDGTVLVVRDNYSEKESVSRAVDLVHHVGGKIIGTILNDVKASSNGYYGYYGENRK